MALHCPATVHLVGLDGLPAAVESLVQERIAVVCVGEEASLRGSAESVAATLGVPLRVSPELGDEEPLHDALLDLADQYRGEHVLVLVSGHHQLLTLEVGDDGIRRLG